ncbi:MAG: FG-GAP-like repeat-containing protein [Bacteroidota bacterium]
MIPKSILWPAIALLFVQANPTSAQSDPLFREVPAVQSGIEHTNTVVETPERFLWHFDYYYTGSGVAVGDLDRDGRPDLVFGGQDSPSSVYLNEGNLRFRDISATCGIRAQPAWTNGVNLIDLNEDGWLDIYLSNGGPSEDPPVHANQLFINRGIDEKGQLQFEEAAAQYGIAGVERSIHANFFDYDRDGDLDLFVNNHTHPEFLRPARNRQLAGDAPPRERASTSSRLYRRDDTGRFEDVTASAGIENTYFGLGSSVADFNGDGWLDLYVSNDYLIPDYLWLNQGDGTFVDGIKQTMGHVSWFGMGCDLADLNNDGLEDLLVADMTPSDHVRNKMLMAPMHPSQFYSLVNEKRYIPQYMFNTLQLNLGGGQYSEVAQLSGLAQSDWTWAVLLADFDLDGHKDVLFSTGFYRDIRDNDWRLKMSAAVREKRGKISLEEVYELQQSVPSVPVPNRIFQNRGDLHFSERTQDWGLDKPTFSNGAAYADLDGDGDLDLVFNNLMHPATIYENRAVQQSPATHYLRVALSDEFRTASTLHAEVRIRQGEQVQVMTNKNVRGYASQVEPVVHFGLGAQPEVNWVEVRWPDGSRSRIDRPGVDQTLRIEKNDPAVSPVANEPDSGSPYFREAPLGIPYRHRENQFYDFEQEKLLPHRQSRLGPALATGDLNGDGLDELYLGGARGQQGELYLQRENQTFERSEQAALVSTGGYEDLDAQFVDLDGDGDLDLYVSSGGDGTFPENTRWMQDRIYLNDGRGQLTEDREALPTMHYPTATARFADWDGDGDLDLFVGGRNLPGRYPFAPPSQLLRNEAGRFVAVGPEVMPDLTALGLVTDAEWADLDGNGWLDLLVVGEWMPLVVFYQTEGRFERRDLADSQGWWYSLAKADFDGDGDTDFVVGNVGLNNKFHPSPERPLHIYTNDFDGNGTYDIVLSKDYRGEEVPVRGRQCSASQMPMLQRKFPTYRSFAEANLVDIYTPHKLDEALHLRAQTMAHVYLENDGGQLRLRPLPRMSQIAPIYDWLVEDLDGDGRLDLVAAGNNWDTEVETPRYDGGRGMILLNRPEGFVVQYHWIDTGLRLHKNLRRLARVRLGENWGLLGSNNNDRIQFYPFNRP